MKQLYPDLWQSTIHDAGAYQSHAYLLTRPDGNALIYNTPHEGDRDTIAELGGVERQLLSHRDESGPSLNRIRERFGSQLYASATEAEALRGDAETDIEFDPIDCEVGGIEVVHTPGHTDGSVCFFYRSPHGKSYLFPGDTFFQVDGRWRTFVVERAGGAREALAKSLARLRGLDPDVVLFSAFVGGAGFVEPSDGEWARAIDDAVEWLARAD